jgi:UDP-glucose 4-epimerase
MKILVTGGLGHIGSFLINSIPSEYEVIAVDNMDTRRYCSLFNLKRYVKIIREDISTLSATSLEGVDVVLHLAGITTAVDSDKLTEGLKKDVFDTVHMLRISKAAGVKKFIFPSTTSLYGTNQEVMTEDSPLKPQSAYAATKLQIEDLISNGDHGDMNYMILRLGTIFGASKGMRFHTAVNKLCLQAALGEKLTVWKENINFKRPYLGLKDLRKCILHFINREKGWNQTYNLLSENIMLSDIVLEIKKHKESVDIDMIHSPLDNQFDYIVSDEKIRSQGFLPSQTIQTGILETFILLGGIE